MDGWMLYQKEPAATGEGAFFRRKFHMTKTFDLTVLRGDQLNALESFDITGSGDNVLIIDTDIAFSATRDENALTGTANTLIIDGNAGDTVEAGAGWSNTGTLTIGGDGYSVYENGDNDAQIFVNTALSD